MISEYRHTSERHTFEFVASIRLEFASTGAAETTNDTQKWANDPLCVFAPSDLLLVL